MILQRVALLQKSRLASLIAFYYFYGPISPCILSQAPSSLCKFLSILITLLIFFQYETFDAFMFMLVLLLLLSFSKLSIHMHNAPLFIKVSWAVTLECFKNILYFYLVWILPSTGSIIIKSLYTVYTCISLWYAKEALHLLKEKDTEEISNQNLKHYFTKPATVNTKMAQSSISINPEKPKSFKPCYVSFSDPSSNHLFCKFTIELVGVPYKFNGGFTHPLYRDGWKKGRKMIFLH
jgi:hypothetical protein